MQVRLVKEGKLQKQSLDGDFRNERYNWVQVSMRRSHWTGSLFTAHVENLDKLLDELEALAVSELPTARLYEVVVERLQLVLSAQAVVLLFPVAGSGWLPLARSGDATAEVPQELARRLGHCRLGHCRLGRSPEDTRQETPEVLMGSVGGAHWFACPVRPGHFERGCLLTWLTGPITGNTLAGLLELQRAFGEVIALRQQADWEAFIDATWGAAQEIHRQLPSMGAYGQAANWLTSELARVLGAARVTLMTLSSSGRPQVQAISGVPQVHKQSATRRALEAVGAEVCRRGQPVLRHQSGPPSSDPRPVSEMSADGSFANLIAVCLDRQTPATEENGPAAGDSLLVIEFQSHAELVSGATRLPHLLPSVAVAWHQHVRWLRLPRPVRRWSQSSTLPRKLSPTVKWIALAVLLAVAVWIAFWPSRLVIEAEGAYEPVTSRDVYASFDGFIEELLVADGDHVQAGQALVQLRSPELELKWEQTRGSARGVEEEANSLRIAMNQLPPDSSDLLSQQSRLASKVAELDIQLQSLQEQLQLLEQQRARLKLLAPITGSIVAKDLQRQLAGRPVRRGEPLFTIVDQAGAWHIRLQVADRDAGYVLQHFPLAAAADRPSNIEFCLTSAPEQRYAAQVTWIADHVENRHGEGCSLEVRAQPTDVTAPQSAFAGAGVNAFLECGQQPLWFVWCRPAVEAMQRRMWFYQQQRE